MQQYDLTKGKNASDIALVIDAMDIMYTKDIDVMCFISSDCDFTPMVTRAIAEGKVVLGFGERKTPSPFVNACSKFLYPKLHSLACAVHYGKNARLLPSAQRAYAPWKVFTGVG